MAKRYWTADLHFGHGNIITYCNRPFRNVEHMNERLICEANNRVKADDTCIHVGDFCTRGVAKGVEGLRHRYDHYVNQFEGNWVLMEGNHDKQNKTKTIGRHLFTTISHFNVFATHYPTDSNNYNELPVHDPELIEYVYKNCDFVICGHVHEKWLYKLHYVIEGQPPLININVGVDQHKYRPISDDELVNLYLKIRKENS